MTLFSLGEFVPAREHLEQGIALYDPQQHRSLAFLYGYDPGVACLSYAALALWYLGYPDQALKRSHEALTLAQELSHPFSLALALVMAAMLHQFRREGQAAQERAEAAIALSTEQGFPYWLAAGNYRAGLGAGRAGTGRGGNCPDAPGPGCLPGHGAEWRPYFLALLAEAYGKVGQARKG